MVKMTLKEMYEIKKINELKLLSEANDSKKEQELQDFINKINNLIEAPEIDLIPVLKSSFMKLKRKLLVFFRDKKEKKFFGLDKLFGGFPGSEYREIRNFFKDIQKFISQLRKAFFEAKKSLSLIKGKRLNKDKPIKELLEILERRKSILNELKNLNLRFKRKMKEAKTAPQRKILKEAFKILKESVVGGDQKSKAIEFVESLISQIDQCSDEQDCFDKIKNNSIPGLRINGGELIFELKIEESEPEGSNESEPEGSNESEPEGSNESKNNLEDFTILLSQADLNVTGIFDNDQKEQFLKEVTSLSINQLENIINILEQYTDEIEQSADELIEFEDKEDKDKEDKDKEDKDKEDKDKESVSIQSKLLSDAQNDNSIDEEIKQKIQKALESKNKKEIDELAKIIGRRRFGDSFERMMAWFKKQKLLKNRGEN